MTERVYPKPAEVRPGLTVTSDLAVTVDDLLRVAKAAASAPNLAPKASTFRVMRGGSEVWSGPATAVQVAEGCLILGTPSGDPAIFALGTWDRVVPVG